MAELIGGVLLEEAVSGLLNLIIQEVKKTWYFKSKLKEMQQTLEILKPDFQNLEQLNRKLDRRKPETKRLMDLLTQAEDLVKKCKKIKLLNLEQRHDHASKLDEMNKSLLKLVQVDLQLNIAVTVTETFEVVKGLEKVLVKGSSCGWSSNVPPEKCVPIGFEDGLRDLKAMVVKDSTDGDCSVVVVSALGGCGKTTLVTNLCHDPTVKAKFGENIYHAIIPEKYDIKAIVKKLLESKQVCEFESDADAIKQWGNFLSQTKSEMLLVLDDVRSDSIIMNLKFKSPGYRILVTSREAFTQFDTYPLPALRDEDATSLFRRSAFEDGNINIPDELVDKLVKCCKNHPLALTVIGGLLKRKPEPSWKKMLKTLSEGNRWFTKSHKSIQDCLEKGLYLFSEEPDIKQCYLDLGLFPEDQKIAASALMDMWAHLYKHDEDGSDTMDNLTTLSSKNLATMLPKRKHLQAIAHYCVEEFVTQHDMMRELAIHLSSQEPIEQRQRLIMNTDEHLPQTVNARILSISTDGIFPSTWNETEAPKVEVFVLNFMSNMHPLPEFMQKMESLKVLMITNYGYYFSDIENFPAPQFLSGLTRIRLDHVSICSISNTILMLENLQKLSLIMCKIGNSFNQGTSNKLINILEIDIDSCDDLVTFPAILCNLARLKKLSITNCHELTSISEEFGELSNLEVLRLASCTKLAILPKSTRNLKKLRLLDLYHCLSLQELPQHIGELDSLETIDITGCTGLSQHDLPKSLHDLDKVKLVCDEGISHLWSGFMNMEIEVVEEDPLNTFFKINAK